MNKNLGRVIWEWLPIVLFGLFAVFAITLPAAPLVSMFGLSASGYDYIDIAEAQPYQACVIACVVLGALGFLITCKKVLSYFFRRTADRPFSFTQYSRRNILATSVFLIYYLAGIIITSVIVGNIAKDDGGTGLMKAGGFPIALMVFSILFLLFTVGRFIYELRHRYYIPQSVNAIANYSFYKRINLTAIEIPASVTRIGSGAFMKCSNLSRIDYCGTMAQWNAVKKKDDWDRDMRDYIVCCTDGTIHR